MIADRLRAAILQAAISGKLTDQRPEDGTAAELLEQIAAKRARLVKEGKLKKQKSLPNIGENDDPFVLPDSWRWIRFGDLVEFRMGKTPKRAEQKYWLRGSVPWVSISDMAQGETITSTRESVSDEAISDAFGGVVSPAGTLIMSFKLTIGRCSFLGVDAVHNEAIISVFPIVDTWEILPSYLAYALPIFSSHGDAKAAMKGNTLNSTSLNLMMVSLPPLAEQERIVAKLDEVLPLIDQLAELEREREYLDREFAKAIECAILQAAISGKLTKQHPEDGTAAELLEQIAAERDALVKVGKLKKHKSLPPVTDDEEYFDIPDTWEWTRFSELAIEVCTGPFGSALHRRDYVDDGTPVINPSNIVGDTFVPTVFVNEETSARLSSFALAHGDLVIGRRGEMGRSAVVSEAEAGWLCGTGCFYAKSGENHVFDYVALTLKAPSVRAQLSSSSLGTTMQNLNQTTLRRLPLAVPSRREQLRIDAKLGQLKAPMRSLQQLLQNA